MLEKIGGLGTRFECEAYVNGGAKLVHPGGAKLVHLMLCGTRCWGVVPVVPSINSIRRRNLGILGVPTTALAGCTEGRSVDDEAR